ncbi:MAG: hypothetical protein IT210_14535 [Armatimonadetes bacterium]|nr:hypothetical protein [Armatimonadota bacterium]
MDNGSTDEAARKVAEIIERITASTQAGATVGPPHSVGNRTLIVLSEILYGGGFGLGSKVSPGPDGAPPHFGGGGGGGGRSRPVAVVEASPDDVRVRPVIDFTQIGLAALGAAVMGFSLWRRLADRQRR